VTESTIEPDRPKVWNSSKDYSVKDYSVGRWSMPDYEFYYHACMKTFSKVLPRAEYEEGEVLCPQFTSDNIE
jgi:hypothetical protein